MKTTNDITMVLLKTEGRFAFSFSLEDGDFKKSTPIRFFNSEMQEIMQDFEELLVSDFNKKNEERKKYE